MLLLVNLVGASSTDVPEEGDSVLLNKFGKPSESNWVFSMTRVGVMLK